ncbi:hypothetical protein SMMN14_07033 [Sphaerulina musiva]
MMQFSSRICKWVAISLALVILANAQTYTPTQTWNIAAATGGTTDNVGCTLGLANQADPNGYYDDPFGARYAIRCQQDSNGFVYDQAGTSNQGVYGCSKGCDNRPTCRGWSYIGYQTTGTSGVGRCYFRMDLGQFSSNSSVYAGAQLLSNGTPRLPCPYYNSTTFIDSQGYQWLVRCGFDVSASDTGSPLYGGTNMTDCMIGCNGYLTAVNPCTMFSYVSPNGYDIPPDNVPGAIDCYFKYGTPSEYGGGTVNAAYASRIAATPVFSTTRVSSTRTSATTTSSTPVPAASTPVPAASTPVPAASTPVPAASTPVPAASTPVPAASTPVPAASTPVPAVSTPVPAATTLVSSTRTTLRLQLIPRNVSFFSDLDR